MEWNPAVRFSNSRNHTQREICYLISNYYREDSKRANLDTSDYLDTSCTVSTTLFELMKK